MTKLTEPHRYPDGGVIMDERVTAAHVAKLSAEVLALRAEVERLREALEPFATCLSRYKFSEHQLILLSEDNPKGRRLNHLRPANFDRARAALGEGGE